MVPTATVAVILLVALAGCAAAPTLEPWPVDPGAQMRPDEMFVAPLQARPGAIVSVTYADARDRGILYAIEEQTPDGWIRHGLMISDANGGRPLWFEPDDPDVAVEAVGIGGIGPDHVPIPDDIGPGGSYRICTANAGENICTPIDVVGS